MNRHDNQLGRGRRYCEVLVTASLAARLDKPASPDPRDWRYRPLAMHWAAVIKTPRGGRTR